MDVYTICGKIAQCFSPPQPRFASYAYGANISCTVVLVQSYNLEVVLMCHFIGRLIFTGRIYGSSTNYIQN